jgi:hypothetical protein
VHKAGVLSEGQLGYLLNNMRSNSPIEFQDKAFVTLTCFTALRSQDVDNILSYNIKVIPSDDKTPRRY